LINAVPEKWESTCPAKAAPNSIYAEIVEPLLGRSVKRCGAGDRWLLLELGTQIRSRQLRFVFAICSPLSLLAKLGRPVRRRFSCFPFTQGGEQHCYHQCQSQRNVKYRRRENKHSGSKKGNHCHQPRMVKNVVEDEKQQSCRRDCQATIHRVTHTEGMSEKEAAGSNHKQQGASCNDNPLSPVHLCHARALCPDVRDSARQARFVCCPVLELLCSR
jgi:hypothetical protein